MRNQYTCRKLMIRLLIILIILNLNLFRLEPVSVSQSEGPLISLERISAFREVMAHQAGGEEEQLELPALPPATGQVFFSSQDYEPVSPPRRVEPVPLPPQVRGVYVTGWTAGSPARFSALLELAEKTCINSLVIDIKDDTGLASYYSGLPAVRKLGAWEEKLRDPQKMLATLKQRGIYPIARLVLFKDPVLARKRPDLAVQNVKGGIWVDNKGLAWVDPNSREVWEYNIAIAKEAAAMGFPEIQFDYVRFPSDGRLENCLYSHGGEKTKPEVIEDFLRYAREQLEPLGVLVSVDLFGLVCSDPGHIGIGQNLEGVAGTTDILSPMVYPSHYYPGTYGLADPDRQPYATVYRSLTDAQKRLARGEWLVRGVRLRPWLQAFSIKAKYGREEVLAQIKAARAAGVDDWLFWNAGSRYNPAHYPDEEELAALATVPPGPPRQEEPLAEDPATEGQLTEEPATEDPLTEEPVTEEPLTEEPATEGQLTEEPATEEPLTEEPVTEESLAEDPVTEEISMEGPATEEPLVEGPLTEEPVTEETSTEGPAAGELLVEEPLTEEPVTEGPLADEPGD
ncbi:MAG TPA: hypothetical protein GXZ26_04015 [Firmicutes bacterium]|jgi:hypothetical protein|nr:hypothetical protein [Bacillota bacterium]